MPSLYVLSNWLQFSNENWMNTMLWHDLCSAFSAGFLCRSAEIVVDQCQGRDPAIQMEIQFDFSLSSDSYDSWPNHLIIALLDTIRVFFGRFLSTNLRRNLNFQLLLNIMFGFYLFWFTLREKNSNLHSLSVRLKCELNQNSVKNVCLLSRAPGVYAKLLSINPFLCFNQ